jgi:hypothetical protein
MNLRISKNVENFLSSLAAAGFLRRAPLHGVSELVNYEAGRIWVGVRNLKNWTLNSDFLAYCKILSIYGCTALVGLDRSFSFVILYTVCRTPWTGDQPVARPLPTHENTNTE